MESHHSGVLSVVANRMTEAARGAFCCRLDGDVVVLTNNWAAELCRIFDGSPPGLGVVGAKQLGPDGRVHSAGDWVLHPRGYHHVGQGAPRAAIDRAVEVDHVMGCFYAHRRSVWAELGGYDETLLRGQTVDLSLRARRAGHRIICTPTIEFAHYHAHRAPRDNHADTPAGIAQTHARFRDKWGFDRIAPDLDEVARRYAGTPLLWNASVFGPAAPWPPGNGGSAGIANSEWTRFRDDLAYRESVLWRVRLVEQVTGHLGPRRHVGHFCSRGGLLCHLLARNRVPCTGVDPDPAVVRLAESVAGREDYPADPPSFRAFAERDRMPLDDGALDMLLLFDVLDGHPNPVGLYRAAHRVLEPGGILLVVSRLRTSPLEGDHPACAAYRPHELRMQLDASGFFEPLPIKADASGRGLLVVVARRASTVRATEGEGVKDDVVQETAGGGRRVPVDAPAELAE
jgi:SAM-dependent methyltransferase